MALFGFGKEEEKKDVAKKDATPVSGASDAQKTKTKSVVKDVPKKEKKDVAKKDEKKSENKEQKSDGASAYGVIIKPIMTEKSHSATDRRTYTFRVDKKADKGQVRRAIEDLYDVSVEKVRVLNMPVRRRTIGRNRGYQSAYRKALVTVAQGNKIDFFEGV